MTGYRSANRQEAKDKGKTHFFNEKPCKRGHTSARRVTDNCCQECNRTSVKKWRQKTGYKTNPELVKQWRESQSQERLRSYEQTRDMEKVYRRNMAKRAKLRNACPPWLSTRDREKISDLYKTCKKITLETGVKHEVDHIIPINGKTVCGLHVPWNMRVITRSENRAKFNKLENSNG